MKPINVDRQLSPSYPPEEHMAPMPLYANRFLGLRTKFVLLFSLILVIACSTLSWFFYIRGRLYIVGLAPGAWEKWSSFWESFW